MAFHRPGRKTYYTELRVGAITLPRMSTGLTVKDEADELEQALKTIHRWGFDDLIRKVALRQVSLQEIWTAWHADDIKAELRRLDGSDPFIADDVAYMLEHVTTDERVRLGLRRLRELVPDNATRSWLTVPKHINQVYRKAAKGRESTTVYRSVHRAIADLLSEMLGNGTALKILKDAKTPKASNTRKKVLTAEQIQGLVYGAPDELRPALAVTLLTGVDSGPLLKMLVRDYDRERKALWVPDTKTNARPRALPLEDSMAAWVEFAAGDKPPDRSLFGLTVHERRGRWEALRKAQGLDDLTWKDLRGVCATWAHQCGWDALRIQHWLGHSGPTMTQRYIKQVELLPREPRPLAEAMGIAEVR